MILSYLIDDMDLCGRCPIETTKRRPPLDQIQRIREPRFPPRLRSQAFRCAPALRRVCRHLLGQWHAMGGNMGQPIMALWLQCMLSCWRWCDTSLTPPEMVEKKQACRKGWQERVNKQDPVTSSNHAKDCKNRVHFSSGIVETCLNTAPNTSSISTITQGSYSTSMIFHVLEDTRRNHLKILECSPAPRTYHLDVILAEIQFFQPRILLQALG